MKTLSAKAHEARHDWFVVDASDKILGRLAAEIARALSFRSPNAAESHLRALERKGVIEILQGAARGIRLTEAPGIPLIGRVAAGSPILAEEHVERRYQFDPSFFKPHADYLLRVRGMSMRDVGILDGDLLAVHRTAEARSGQIVVALFFDSWNACAIGLTYGHFPNKITRFRQGTSRRKSS